MNIERAKKLIVGETVYFPADRGDPKGSGVVTCIGDVVYVRADGVEYMWISVKSCGVWPSNRLG